MLRDETRTVVQTAVEGLGYPTDNGVGQEAISRPGEVALLITSLLGQLLIEGTEPSTPDQADLAAVTRLGTEAHLRGERYSTIGPNVGSSSEYSVNFQGIERLG